MAYPFPSFSSFQFRKEEQPVWESDAGWVLAPTYSRTRPFGSNADVITTLAIGSAERSFELYLSVDRFEELQGLLNTSGEFTDWARPFPDSRLVFLTEMTPISDAVSNVPGGINLRKRRTKITFVSA